MHKLIRASVLTVCGVVLAPLLFTFPSSAHKQQTASGNITVMIHLDPNDSPRARKASKTWFMLMRRGDKGIPPSNCACQVSVYDSRNQVVARNLPLSSTSVEGHKKDHRAVSTTITFPKPGSYTVVLAGKAKDNSFETFQLKFPVTVRS